jgi:hypothetical protein
MPPVSGRGRPRPLSGAPGSGPGRCRPGDERSRAGRAGVSVKAIASRIAAEPVEVAAVLHDELVRGRVTRDGDRWRLVADAFPAGTVEALCQLA